jgi:hypothetical protein
MMMIQYLILIPEHDKFNLANQLPREELLEAHEEQNVTGDSSAET